jgi:hypothetical protein
MAWPTNDSNIVTTNLDSGTDSPAAARADLKTALDELANVINGRNQASGVAGLNASSKIANTQLPDTIISSSSTDLTIDPNTGVVVIQDVVQLNPIAFASLPASPAKGQCAFLTTDGAAASQDKPIYYDGSAWKYFGDDSAVATS